jgi:AAA family ATPase
MLSVTRVGTVRGSGALRAVVDIPGISERASLEWSRRFVAAFLIGRHLALPASLPCSLYGARGAVRVDLVDPQERDKAEDDEEVYVVLVLPTTSITVEFPPSQPAPSQVISPSHPPPPPPPAAAAASVSLTVGGLARQWAVLRQLVVAPLTRPGDFLALGVDPPRGVLLFGPPGTGKTLLARSVAASCGASCFDVTAAAVVSKLHGETEANIAAVFARALAAAPAVVFLDELDTLCPAPPPHDPDPATLEGRMARTVEAQIDSLPAGCRVVVVAATNKPLGVDPGLRRPGRLDREVEVGVPTREDREAILRVHLGALAGGWPEGLAEADVASVAGVTHGYVGADLAQLVAEAGHASFRRGVESGRREPVTAADLRLAVTRVRPSALREMAAEVPLVTWADIGGRGAMRQVLREVVEWPLERPEAFTAMGIRPPRGVLMYGPPGCSKTLLAKALANEAGLGFIAVKGPELFSKWVGESEKAVREVFRVARAAAPTIVFFDEIDALGGARGADGGGGAGQVADRVLSQLLIEMDGVQPLSRVVVLAATNRPDMLDEALLRPGRFDRLVYVGPPSEEERLDILRVHLRRLPLDQGVHEAAIAARLDGYSGAEIAAVCREAGLAAMRDPSNPQAISQAHFDHALSSVTPRITQEMLQPYEDFQSKVQKKR